MKSLITKMFARISALPVWQTRQLRLRQATKHPPLTPFKAMENIDKLGLPPYSSWELTTTGAYADRDRIEYSEADAVEADDERKRNTYKK